ncbi:uncharacterized protein METZ01_LOCUS244943 [marine metagenome]|uniref:Uncharacterized protein n=1 Tax=marine metagenome TaxID=408172 RepID=A0A382HYC9_9ZZZZ
MRTEATGRAGKRLATSAIGRSCRKRSGWQKRGSVTSVSQRPRTTRAPNVRSDGSAEPNDCAPGPVAPSTSTAPDSPSCGLTARRIQAPVVDGQKVLLYHRQLQRYVRRSDTRLMADADQSRATQFVIARVD